jgi:hypothetical protein
LDCIFYNSQLNFNNASTTRFDNTRNLALILLQLINEEIIELDCNSASDKRPYITGIIKSLSTSVLYCDLNNSQIISNNASTAGFDDTRNIALNRRSLAVLETRVAL